MMNKKDWLGDILYIILWVCVFNFGVGFCGGVGDEEDWFIMNEEFIIFFVDEYGLKVCKLCSFNILWRFRKILDVVKVLLVLFCVCIVRDLDIFDDINGVVMWKWIKILYYEVV